MGNDEVVKQLEKDVGKVVRLDLRVMGDINRMTVKMLNVGRSGLGGHPIFVDSYEETLDGMETYKGIMVHLENITLPQGDNNVDYYLNCKNSPSLLHRPRPELYGLTETQKMRWRNRQK